MIRKISISFILVLCIGLTAFAKGGPQNPSSKWKKFAARISSQYKVDHRGGSYAKKPTKPPYVITSLNWDNSASAYTDSAEKYVMSWNADNTPKQMVIYLYGSSIERYVTDSFVQITGGEAFNDFDFLGDWLPVRMTRYVKSGSTWTLSERATITNSSRGMENILFEDWTGTAWENASREYNLFDTQDMPLGYLDQDWISGAWVNIEGERVDYVYNGNGNAVQADFTIMKMGGVDWEPVESGTFKEVYTIDIYEEISSALVYSTNGTDILIDSIGGILWHDFQAMESDFLSTGGSQYASYTSYWWDDANGLWSPYQNYSKTYNTGGLEIEQVVQIWDDNTSQWINESRMTQDYYANEDLKEVLFYGWSGGTWQQSTGFRWNNTYDTDGDITEEMVDFYNATAWEKGYKTIYSYTEPVGIKDSKGLPQVKLYPNPASAKIIVELPGNNGENCSLRIFNLNGQAVSATSAKAPGQTIEVDVAHLSPGTYILSLESGNMVRTSRFVKR